MERSEGLDDEGEDALVVGADDEHRVGPQGYLNGSYSNRGIGAVRVRATHADRDDGNENESAKERQVRL